MLCLYAIIARRDSLKHFTSVCSSSFHKAALGCRKSLKTPSKDFVKEVSQKQNKLVKYDKKKHWNKAKQTLVSFNLTADARRRLSWALGQNIFISRLLMYFEVALKSNCDACPNGRLRFVSHFKSLFVVECVNIPDLLTS